MTLIERARKWGEERDQLWLQKGIERERRASIQRERKLVRRMVRRRFGPRTAESSGRCWRGSPTRKTSGWSRTQ